MINRFPFDEIALKIAAAIGSGMLVGLEREWANKDIGVRTFSLAGMLGMLGGLLGLQFALGAFLAGIVLVIFVNWRSLVKDGSLEITTSTALLVTVTLGVLVGQGHLFTPVACAIVMTMLLAWKMELHRFAGGLKPEEIRSAVLLGLLGFVIYPILPNEYVDQWHLLNPREAWITIVIVALIGFVNYVLLRVYSSRGLYFGAVLGGLVNSTATVAELTKRLSAQPELESMALPVVVLAVLAMCVRNLVLLVVFAPQSFRTAVIPLGVMIVAALLLVFRHGRNAKTVYSEQLELGSPVSLRYVFSFGAIFLLIGIAGTLAQRYLGQSGFLLVSGVGGLVSSASSTAAAANMVHRGTLTATLGGLGAVLASAASALVQAFQFARFKQRTQHAEGAA
ncbi:MAG TPA: DUF4010 domain-containing protein [Candidatus Angelobacter sp.]|jgi:uncharacterized membrane protein (DUF4010 family)